MMEKKLYLQPGRLVFDALLDIMELQKGVETLNDPIGGKLHFVTYLYGEDWEIRFSITDIDRARCAVNIEIAAKDRNGDMDGYSEIMARREFALLDSILLIGTSHEISLREGG